MQSETFLADMTQLQLEYVAARLQREADRDLAHGVSRWTYIRVMLAGDPACRETDWVEARWQEFLRALEEPFAQHGQTAPGMFAAQGTDWILPLLKDTAARVRPRDDWFGCFRYGFHQDTGHVALHFRNAVAPESPFADMAARFQELVDIVIDIQAKGVAPKTIGCASWLDNLEPFQQLFPPSFKESFTPSSLEAQIGFGCWGQFITKEGEVNPKRAARFRETWEFPYVRMNGACAFEAFEAHVGQTREQRPGVSGQDLVSGPTGKEPDRS